MLCGVPGVQQPWVLWGAPVSVLGLLQSPPQPPLPGQKNLSASLLSEKYCLCSDKAAL